MAYGIEQLLITAIDVETQWRLICEGNTIIIITVYNFIGMYQECTSFFEILVSGKTFDEFLAISLPDSRCRKRI